MKRILMDMKGEVHIAAMVENDVIMDLIVESARSRSLVGNIYIGIVKNILPNKFTFIDIGESKNAFLDMGLKEKGVRNGSQIIVQVMKDSTGAKGTLVSTKLSIAGYMVVMLENGGNDVGVSGKIAQSGERKRLKKIGRKNLPKGFGVILRTGCVNKNEEMIKAEMEELAGIIKGIRKHGTHGKPPALLHSSNSILKELIRDDIDEIIVNNPNGIEKFQDEAELIPGFGDKVTTYEERLPLFDFYNVRQQWDETQHKMVWLPCGGFLIIDQTEACAVIDVNTGRYQGNRNQRESILKINAEAAVVAAHHIRLRNLSGMIIIDFIDMREPEDVQKLHSVFENELAKDRIRTNIVGMTELGLMQLTRKKTREPISMILNHTCPMCGGAGNIPSGRYIT